MKQSYKKRNFNEFTLAFANSFFYNTRNVPIAKKPALTKILMLNSRPYQHKIWKVSKPLAEEKELNLQS